MVRVIASIVLAANATAALNQCLILKPLMPILAVMTVLKTVNGKKVHSQEFIEIMTLFKL